MSVLTPSKEFFERIPTAPGVYLMKDRAGRIVYVGKAKNLRARVRQYFRPGADARFFVTAGLLGRVLADVETVVVDNEKEALLLENQLIKKHQPRFNVNLRDDKPAARPRAAARRGRGQRGSVCRRARGSGQPGRERRPRRGAGQRSARGRVSEPMAGHAGRACVVRVAVIACCCRGATCGSLQACLPCKPAIPAT